jgi:hypothetical protein
MVLVWVLYAFLELFLYLPLLSGAFLAYAQVLGNGSPACCFLVAGYRKRYRESR